MTDKQKIFADEYLTDLNATRAYKVAYPKVKNDNTAAANASRMLRNAKVQKYITERQEERQERTEVTQDMIVRELAAIAFANTTDFVRVVKKDIKHEGKTISIAQVEVILTEKLTEKQKKAIASVKEGRNGIEVKAHDKVKALELLGRHLGMWNDKLEVEGAVKLEDLL